jgi:hypothetical protein
VKSLRYLLVVHLLTAFGANQAATAADTDCPQWGRSEVAFPNGTAYAAEMKGRATITMNPLEIPPLVRLVLASVAQPSASSHNTDP